MARDIVEVRYGRRRIEWLIDVRCCRVPGGVSVVPGVVRW